MLFLLRLIQDTMCSSERVLKKVDLTVKESTNVRLGGKSGSPVNGGEKDRRKRHGG